MNKLIHYLSRLDWLLAVASFILLLFGLVILYSLNLAAGREGVIFFSKQAIAGFVGLLAMLMVAVPNYRQWQNYGWLAYLIAFVLLVLVLFFGQEIRNIKAWFIIGPISIQPVELVKVLFIIFLAKYFSGIDRGLYTFKHIVISGIATLALMVPIAIQPDLGSAFILFIVWLLLIVIVPFRRRYYLVVLVVLILAALVGWQWALAPYQKQRIITFLNPVEDVLGEGYNITQARVAVGAGGFFGRGLGLGTQSQLKFLPEAQTDFIFAVIAEEFGLIGAVFLLFLFLVIFFRLFKIARLSRTDFGMFIVLGISLYLFVQTAVNIGMNIGLFPVAGVPLPFISSGGSSLVAILIAIGLAQSVYVHDQ